MLDSGKVKEAMYKKIVASAALSLFIFTGCDQKTETPFKGETAEAETDGPVMITDDLAGKTNLLGLRLLNDLSEGGSKNMAVSPASITGMFAPLQRGAAGATEEEMKKVLGDTAVFRSFIHQYNRQDNGTSIANLLVLDKDLKLTDEYRKNTSPTEVEIADFKADPEKERQDINSWVEQNTRDLIKDFLKEGSITRQTVLVALNATVFEGNWTMPFDEKATREDIFHAPGREVNTSMMGGKGEYIFSREKEDCTMVSLPYNKKGTEEDSSVSFVILMPNEGVDFSGFLGDLTWEKLAGLLPAGDARKREIILQMPKFEIKTPTLELDKALKKEGLGNVFDPERADFSKLSPAKGLYLDQVYHQCYVKVDEKGTKAAAASGGVVMRMSLPLQIRIDRPFVWFIYDAEHKLVLFCGTYVDPSL